MEKSYNWRKIAAPHERAAMAVARLDCRLAASPVREAFIWRELLKTSARLAAAWTGGGADEDDVAALLTGIDRGALYSAEPAITLFMSLRRKAFSENAHTMVASGRTPVSLKNLPMSLSV